MSNLILLYVVLYFSVFLHELGHAFAITWLPGKRNYIIQIGVGKKLFSFDIRNYKILVNSIPIPIGECRYCTDSNDQYVLSSKNKIGFYLGGILLNLFVALLIYTIFFFNNIELYTYGILENGYVKYIADSFVTGTWNFLFNIDVLFQEMFLRVHANVLIYVFAQIAIVNGVISIWNLIPFSIKRSNNGSVLYSDGTMLIKEITLLARRKKGSTEKQYE